MVIKPLGLGDPVPPDNTMSGTQQPWNRNCSHCHLMGNGCNNFLPLVKARDCPSYDDGTQAQADRAKAEISAFIHGDGGAGNTGAHHPSSRRDTNAG
jgi:hypothetical protein